MIMLKDNLSMYLVDQSKFRESNIRAYGCVILQLRVAALKQHRLTITNHMAKNQTLLSRCYRSSVDHASTRHTNPGGFSSHVMGSQSFLNARMRYSRIEHDLNSVSAGN